MRIWAIANQKGGVGKTTSTLAIGRGLAAQGHRVLLMDLDPHSSLTRAFGVPLAPAPQGVLELFATPPLDIGTLALPARSPIWIFCALKQPWRRWSGAVLRNPGLAWHCNKHLRGTASSTITY